MKYITRFDWKEVLLVIIIGTIPLLILWIGGAKEVFVPMVGGYFLGMAAIIFTLTLLIRIRGIE